LAEGRKAVFSPDGPAEWGTPVLFMRSPDGILWDSEALGNGPEIVVTQPPVSETHGKPTSTGRKQLPMIAWLLGAIAFLAILGFGLGILSQKATGVVVLTDTLTPSISTETHTPIPPTPIPPTATQTSTQTPTLPPPMPVETSINKVDGATYVYIPSGEFIMGSTNEQANFIRKLCQLYYDKCRPSKYENEKPQHRVHLNSYWLMQTEVTHAQYNKFIEAGGYTNEKYWDSAGLMGHSNQSLV